jgi:hypothetical protein
VLIIKGSKAHPIETFFIVHTSSILGKTLILKRLLKLTVIKIFISGAVFLLGCPHQVSPHDLCHPFNIGPEGF